MSSRSNTLKLVFSCTIMYKDERKFWWSFSASKLIVNKGIFFLANKSFLWFFRIFWKYFKFIQIIYHNNHKYLTHQVEVMVMRALALGLVKGTIDQVSRQVNITWVQPRVLHKNQVSVLLSCTVLSLHPFRIHFSYTITHHNLQFSDRSSLTSFPHIILSHTYFSLHLPSENIFLYLLTLD